MEMMLRKQRTMGALISEPLAKDGVQIGLSCQFRNIKKENAHSGTV